MPTAINQKNQCGPFWIFWIGREIGKGTPFQEGADKTGPQVRISVEFQEVQEIRS